MSEKDNFIKHLYTEFYARRHCKYSLNEYFHDPERYQDLKEKAETLGLYFWVHINFTVRTPPLLRIGTLEDKARRQLFDSSSEEDSDSESTGNLIDKKELEFRATPPNSFDLLDDIASVDGSASSTTSGFLQELEYLDDIEDFSLGTNPSVLEPITFGSCAEFAIVITDSSDEETCLEF